MLDFPTLGTVGLLTPRTDLALAATDDEHTAAWAELVAQVQGMDGPEWARVKAVAHIANIRAKKKEDVPEKHRLVHLMEPRLNKVREEMIDSMGQVWVWDTPDWPYFAYPQGLSYPYAFNLKGYYYDGLNVQPILLRDLMDLEKDKPSHEKHRLYRLLFQSTLCLVGRTGTGKSVLAHMIAQHLCITRGRMKSYFFTKSLDSLGVQTKDGNMKSFGAMVYDDLELRSLQNTKLEKSHLLSLFHVQGGGSFIARYHDAILPKGVPKIMTQNHTVDSAGNQISWFKEHNLDACDALMRGDQAGVTKFGQKDEAIARRMIIFDVTESLINQSYWQHLQDKEYDEILKVAGDREADPPWEHNAPQRKLDAPRSPRLAAPKAKSVARSSV
jgi:hypothetical protein